MTGTPDTVARILVVDDSGFARGYVTQALRRAGHDVRGVGSAREAEELLEEERFDVAITDLFMPGTGGIELLERLRRRDPDMEVILMTGKASLESAVEAMRGRASDYLLKPMDEAALLRSVARVLEARARGCPLQDLAQLLAGPAERPEVLARLARAAARVVRSSLAVAVGAAGEVAASPPERASAEVEASARRIAGGAPGGAAVSVQPARGDAVHIVLQRGAGGAGPRLTAVEQRMLRVVAAMGRLLLENAELRAESRATRT